jgi:hypothetical protein
VIVEWLQYLTTPTQLKVARKMGYLTEAIAMAARRGRCQQAWQAHFEQCQQAILQLTRHCQSKRKIVILGAGSLRDIPLARLSADFEKVVLVDIVFLSEARRFAKRFSNVELVEADITGWSSPILEGVYQKPSRLKADLALLKAEGFQNSEKIQNNARIPSPAKSLSSIMDAEVDAVVSLNLITQIPLIPVRWLIEKRDFPEALAGELGHAIVQQHLNWLQSLPAQVCLIADRLDQEFDDQGRVIDEWDPTWEVELPVAEKKWTWTLMPIGEYHKSKGQRNLVGVSYFREAI